MVAVTEGAQPLSRKRRLVFSAIAAVIPVLFFVLLEGVLRLGGYGQTLPLFVPVPGADDMMVQNREVGRRYFTRQARVPTSIGDAFATEKQPGTIRIFVQGGSSAAGYPYYFGGSFSRMLEQRLQQTYPDRQVEVVNTAMAAVNSYTLLDFAREIVEQEPDAVLIYAGHNEYYGALGVGSAETFGGGRWMTSTYLRLQHWRTMQLLRAALRGVAGLFAERQAGQVPGATLMERMVSEQEIPPGSPLYNAGMDQFSGNLRDLLSLYHRAEVPVFVGTVASNERDHPPFLSAPLGDAAQRQLDEGTAFLDAGRPEDALRLLEPLYEQETESADVTFALARTLESMGRPSQAMFESAKDLDWLRFRAPEGINAVIRRESSRGSAEVVETRRALAQASAGGVIDSGLMLEHLHPNVDGYFLIADAFYEALMEGPVFGAATPVPAHVARTQLLITPVDSLFGEYRVVQLMSSWPFQPAGTAWTDTLVARTPLEQITLPLFRGETSWFEATSRLRAHQEEQGDTRSALRTTLAQIQQYPFMPGPYAAAGELLLRERRADEALIYFEAALVREESAAVREVIGDVHAALGRHADARTAYEVALGIEPSNPDYALKLGRSHAILGDSTAAATVLRLFLERKPDDERVARVLAALEAARSQ